MTAPRSEIGFELVISPTRAKLLVLYLDGAVKLGRANDYGHALELIANGKLVTPTPRPGADPLLVPDDAGGVLLFLQEAVAQGLAPSPRLALQALADGGKLVVKLQTPKPETPNA